MGLLSRFRRGSGDGATLTKHAVLIIDQFAAGVPVTALVRAGRLPHPGLPADQRGKPVTAIPDGLHVLTLPCRDEQHYRGAGPPIPAFGI